MFRRIKAFLLVTAILLALVPCINFIYNDVPAKYDRTIFKKLYSLDLLAPILTKAVYPLGISLFPDRAVIGNDDWLLLGDFYASTRTVTRNGLSDDVLRSSQKVSAVLTDWRDYFSYHGVKVFKVIIAPNKCTIYPESLPLWASPKGPSAIEAAFYHAPDGLFVDPRNALFEAKNNKYGLDIFFRTDTHWNQLGCYAAFRQFAKIIAPLDKELVWPSNDEYALESVTVRYNSDLSSFLRLGQWCKDKVPMMRATARRQEIVQVDYQSGKEMYRGPDQASAINLTKPSIFINRNALNHKKVLWLRDSFGNDMSPLMSMTFDRVLHYYWQTAMANPEKLMEIVEQWKPDYVFMIIVERDFWRDGFFVPLPKS